jgi:rSAM/selenodomain-associated transferase 2
LAVIGCDCRFTVRGWPKSLAVVADGAGNDTRVSSARPFAERKATLMTASVSIVIPTLNEAAVLGATLASLRDHQPHEVIVVDAGSDDSTADIATSAGATVLTGARGRAAQMNLGAAHATGEVLLFLHADCTLEAGALDAARQTLREYQVAAGCFRMCVQAPGMVYRAIDAAATTRVRLTGLIYGDQGMFLARDTFQRVGGFPAVRFMEDVVVSLALRRLGRMRVAPARIFVSPRRWQKVGPVRQTLRNWTLTALAALGVHPDRLAAYYPNVR